MIHTILNNFILKITAMLVKLTIAYKCKTYLIHCGPRLENEFENILVILKGFLITSKGSVINALLC